MVLNRSEEEGSHCIVIPLGKLIELPVRTSEILPPSSRLGGWGGHSDYVETNMFTLALHLFHDFAILNSLQFFSFLVRIATKEYVNNLKS